MMLCIFSGLDSSGFVGQFIYYLTLIFVMGLTILIFLYFWKERKLDMDENPKYQMMRDEHNEKK